MDAIKQALDNDAKPVDRDSGPVITASPLDYHLFRQEITSKYPAFDPPQPLFPFESDSTSMMPPPQEHSTFDKVGEGVGPANVNGNGSSILHQPVHIATPAPSPPPSPAGPGGKGIKKQNYQTNQLFPFLYPPLDDPQDSMNGEQRAELQDLLVGQKWEGRDVPKSILEAAEIFASRMRATRAMKQLWDERVRFIQYEKGYLTSHSTKPNDEDGVEKKQNGDGSKSDNDNLSDDQKRRLQAAEEFYVSLLLLLTTIVLTPAGNRSSQITVGYHSTTQDPAPDSHNACNST